MELTNSESTVPRALTQAAKRGRGGYIFHSGDDPVVLPVAELYEKALGRAAQLGHEGVEKGKMVGLLGPNSPEWAEWAWGTWLAGCVLVPLPAPVRVPDPGAFSCQIASLAEATDCATIVGDRQYLDFLDAGHCPRLDWAARDPSATGQRAAQVSPSDLAIVLCTSGSTAAPKGVRMSHARALVWAASTRQRRRRASVPGILSWSPFYHIGGLGPLFEVFTPVDWHILPMARFVGIRRSGSGWPAGRALFSPTALPRPGRQP